MQVENIQGYNFDRSTDRYENRDEAQEFANMNQVKREMFLQKLLRDSVKRPFKDSVYMYNPENELWEIMKQSEFETWTTCYYDATFDNCLKICKLKNDGQKIQFALSPLHDFLIGSLYDTSFFADKLDRNFLFIPIQKNEN